MAFGRILAFGHNLACSRIMTFGYITVGCCINGLVHKISHIALVGFIGLLALPWPRSLVGLSTLVDCSVIGLVGPIDIVGFVGQIISHVGWPTGLVDHVGCNSLINFGGLVGLIVEEKHTL